MTLVSTATPAVYQQGIEPRVEGAACNVQIMDIDYVSDSQYTYTDVLTLKAYLRVENYQPNEVVLSRLNLDMYHHSALRGRYEMVGYFNTTREYTIPAATENEYGGLSPGYVESQLDAAGNVLHTSSVSGRAGEQYTRTDTFAYISFHRLSNYYGADAPVYEALSDLIQRKFLNVMLRGEARIGPFTFEYQRHQTLHLDVWDSDFVINDIFPAIPNSDPNSDPVDGEQLFFHVQTRNPSRIPIVLYNMSFDLKRADGTLIARGMNSKNLWRYYDPDITETQAGAQVRRSLDEVFGFENIDFLRLPGGTPNTWRDMLLGLNFTDPRGQVYTSENLRYVMSQLFTGTHLDVILQGRANVIIGSFEGNRHIGLNTTIGDQKPFILYDVTLYQKSITNPEPMIKDITLGNINATRMEINSEQNWMGINYTSMLNFTNPYRFDMTLTDVDCSVYRVSDFSPSATSHEFIAGHPAQTETVEAAHRVANDPTDQDVLIADTTVTPTTTTVMMDMYNSYSTDDFLDTSGLAHILEDYNINPQIMNLTDPMFLMEPSGIKDDPNYLRVDDQNEENAYVDPMKVIRYLVQQNIDPLQLIQELDTFHEIYRGTEGYNALEGSFFGTNRSYVESDKYQQTESEDLPYTARTYSIPTQACENGDHSGFFAPARGGNWWTGTNLDQWSRYFDTTSGAPMTSSPIPRELNQYDVLQWGTFESFKGTNPSHWTFAGQKATADFHFRNYQGAIFHSNRTDWDFYPTPPYDQFGLAPRTDEIVWRYHGNAPWGYRFDYEDYQRGYYMGIYAKDNEWGALCQDFALPNWLTDADVEITSVTMGATYRFPTNQPGYALLGLGHYITDPNAIASTAYVYGDETEGNSYPGLYWTSGKKELLIDGRYGWQLNQTNPYSNVAEWQHTEIDVTQEVLFRLNNYTLTSDANWLELEVMVGALGGAASNGEQPVFLDDVTFVVEYERDKTGDVSMLDLWEYLDESDDVWTTGDKVDSANLYKVFEEMQVDAPQFMQFLGDDFGYGVDPGSGSEINFMDFLNYDGSRPYTMSNIFQEQYQEIEGSEALNFLEMMNYSRYVVPSPNSTQRDPQTVVNTEFGPREENQEYWVLEDPYQASRELARALLENMFVIPQDTAFSPIELAGEELWGMFDNLEVYMPWICIYLSTHGWSNDDIWDMLEALGFGAEVKRESEMPYWHIYRPPGNERQDDWRVTKGPTGIMQFAGQLADVTVSPTLNLWLGSPDPPCEVPGGAWSIPIGQVTSDFPYSFEYDLRQTLRDGTAELYMSLMSVENEVVITSWLDGTDITIQHATPLIEYQSAVFDPPMRSDFQMSGNDAGQVDLLITDLSWNETIEMTGGIEANRFGISIYINAAEYPSSLPAQRDNIFFDDQYGFNTAGTKAAVSLLRNDFKMGGETFLRTGGDPMNFFRFLDEYYYDGDTAGKYSSYELLSHFNCKAVDFVEMITGYNWLTDEFDPNNNGRADDWLVPYERSTFNTTSPGDLQEDYRDVWDGLNSTPYEGWGIKFRDSRIFWTDDPAWQPHNGKVIWSDSPDLQYTTYEAPVEQPRGTAHLQGKIYGPGVPTVPPGDQYADRFQGGAPPVVNLIDMLAWLSRATGTPDPDLLVSWLAGDPQVTEGGIERYRYYERLIGERYPQKKGLGRDGTWSLFNNMTMNATGIMNWLENVKNLDGFRFLYTMQQEEKEDGLDVLDPMNLIDFVTHKDIILYPGGTYGYFYRPSFNLPTEQMQVEYASSTNMDLASTDIATAIFSTDDDALRIRGTRPGTLLTPITVEGTVPNNDYPVELERLQELDAHVTRFNVTNGTQAYLTFDLSLTQAFDVKDIKNWKLALALKQLGGQYQAGEDVRKLQVQGKDGTWIDWYAEAPEAGGGYSPHLSPNRGEMFWFSPEYVNMSNYMIGTYNVSRFHADLVSLVPGEIQGELMRKLTLRLTLGNFDTLNLNETFEIDTFQCTGQSSSSITFKVNVPNDGQGMFDWIADLDMKLLDRYDTTGDSITMEIQDQKTGAWDTWYDQTNDEEYQYWTYAGRSIGLGDLSMNLRELTGHPYDLDTLSATDGRYAELNITSVPTVEASFNFNVSIPDENDWDLVQDLSKYSVDLVMDVNATNNPLTGGNCTLKVRNNNTGMYERVGPLTGTAGSFQTYSVPLSIFSTTTNLSNYLQISGGAYYLNFSVALLDVSGLEAYNGTMTKLDSIQFKIAPAYDPTTSMQYIGNFEGQYYAGSSKVNRYYNQTQDAVYIRLNLWSNFSNFENLEIDALKFTQVRTADQEFWKFFNGTWWLNEHGLNDLPFPVDSALTNIGILPQYQFAYQFYQRWRDLEIGDPNNPFDDNLAYNYFRFLQGLYIDQVSWFSTILDRIDKPLDFLAATEIIDYESLIRKATVASASSNASLVGDFTVNLYGTPLTNALVPTGEVNFTTEYFQLRAGYHLLNTYDPDVLYGDAFVFY